MRTIARGNTPENCQKRVDQLIRDGWTQVSKVTKDPTPTIDISFVAVLERKDTVVKKKSNFGNFSF